ncbi:MAG: hypothetical protein IH898_06040, partial [Planctomycetes bacterium]|nr:hypothetical protein [Planctomycetota bacterium]
MQRFDWQAGLRSSAVRRFLANSRRRCYAVSPLFRRLHVEALEDRRMLALVTVTNDLDVVNGDTSSIANLIASDGGDGIALREAIEAANMDATADTIDFAAGLDGSTILLTVANGDLDITQALTIDASSLDGITIDAGDGPDNTFNTGDGVRIFNVDDADFMNQIVVELIGMTLTGGDVVGDGGAINSLENLVVTDTVVDANAATAYGGGIFAGGDGVTISGSTISGNATGFSGGGLASNADVSITSSTVSGNTASGGGGGVAAFGSLLSVVDSTITGNTSVVDGGGVVFDGGGTLSITNSTISQNETDMSGGGVATGMISAAIITHTTITGNTADADNNNIGDGGGLYAEVGIPGVSVFTVTHTILAANFDLSVAGIARDLRVVAGTIRLTFSLVGDNTGSGLMEAPVGVPDGNGNLIGDPGGMGVIDPMLDPLANNGGPTETHALQAGSPT